MRKQVRQYLRRSLCGILSAAMILTGSAIPDLAVHAAQTNVEDSDQTDETLSVETEDVVGAPDAGGDVSDEAAGADQDSSGSEDEIGAEVSGGGISEGDDVTSPDEDADPEDGQDSDDAKGSNAADDEDAAPVLKNDSKSVMAVGDEDSSDTEVSFYFYCAPDKDATESFELGVELWGGAEKISTTADSMASWNNDYVLMTPVDGYSGWYLIPLAISDEVTEDGSGSASSAGFNIYKKASDKEAAKIAGFSGYASDNSDIYKELLGENIESYAVKDWKGYANDGTTDMVTAIMRQITLHVYDGKGTPSLAVKNGGLSVIDSDGKLEELTASKTETWANRYDFSADTGKENWYHLTFIVPEEFKDGDTVENVQLYTKSGETYTWIVNFTDNDSDEGCVNCSPVFAGKIYYKDGKFTDTIEDENQTEGAVTFYYYLGDAEESEEVGLYYWGSNISTTAAEAGWKAYTSDTAYLFTAVTGYKGWYSIPISFTDSGAESGFEIFVKSDSSAPKVKYSASENQTLYGQITSGKNKTCAYKNGISYVGTDETTGVDKAAAIVRNVTLYMFIEDSVPYLQNSSSISVVDETTGAVSTLSGVETVDGGNGYAFTADEENPGWYSVTFTAPGAIQFDKAKICNLYLKNSKGEFSWAKNLVNGETDQWGIDFTPVFNGSTYCKYENGAFTFYSSKAEAEAVTLGQLNALLKSDELAAIEKKGETGYTAESWKKFSDAKTAADQVVGDNVGKEDTFTSDGITTAYQELKSAMEALVSLGADVTFYYYAGDTDDEVGLYYWDDSESKSNITSSADKASWNVWNEGDTYKMTPLEGYKGWYSIPLMFMNGGAKAGFQIYTKTAASEKKASAYKCDADNHEDVYTQLVSGEKDSCAVKNDKAYMHGGKDTDNTDNMVTSIIRQVTLHVYDSANNPYLQMGEAIAASLSVVDEETGKLVPLESETVDEKNGYALQQDEVHKNWYSITFSVPGKLGFDSEEKICNLYGTNKGAFGWLMNLMNGPVAADQTAWDVDFTPVFAGSAYYKDGKFYATMEEADPDANLTALDLLKQLVAEAKELKEEDYRKGWKEFTDALTAAETVLKAAADAETDASKQAPTDEEIKEAYDNLKKAKDALVPASAVDAEINVQKVALADDFITGADISSYIALKDSGVVFKDENGKPLSDSEFFNYLHDGGMNWVRIRIWNDPYNSSGNGYGGGNNDLEKAIRIGKLATNAHMRVLIDFHYSDFWADPKKQKAPKAWAGYTVAEKEKAVYDFTLDSLNALKAAGVDVGMVQVGNETNNGVCGETGWDNMAKLFNAGSRAVRTFDKDCLVAVHFTDPQKGYGSIASRLEKSEVEYDVFASSFYPFGHGDTANLKAELQGIVETYKKKVMAAETSWPTTLVDGDGKGNATPPTIPVGYESQNYGVSVQGQADEMRDLVNAVNEINDAYAGSSLGVFYWEPAWISPYYIKDEDGNDIDSLYQQNFDLWEKYGSGWASSYAAEYDPDDAGQWFGGSAMDNSSWFDFDGTALPTAKIYSLIRTGATTERRIASVDSRPVLKHPLGKEIDWTTVTVTAKYNDGTEEQLRVEWDADERELVNPYKAGEYTVQGIASAGGHDYKIILTVQVRRADANNILVNPDFENGSETPWKKDIRVGSAGGDKDSVVHVTIEDPHGGTKGLHFWSEIGLDFTVSQTVTPEAGTYTFGAYIQGGGADREDVQYAFVEVLGQDGQRKSYSKESFVLQGWKEWRNPEISGIVVEDGDTVEVGLIMQSSVEGAWGTMDDFYLYGTHSIRVADDIEHGNVTANVLKADSGEKVIVTVTPDSAYNLETLTIAGANVTGETLTSQNGTVAFQAKSGEEPLAKAVLTYAADIAEEKSETFTMPNGNVLVSATFKSVFDSETAGKIKLDAKDENGKYIVQVNAKDDENPIAAQFHTGKNVTPAVELSYKGYKLTSADYTVSYANNKDKTTQESKAKLTLTAKGDKFEGTREILFEIKEDTRKEFSAKKLKVVFEQPDKGERTATASKAVYYLGKQKEVEPKIGLYDVSDTAWETPVNPELYKVYYQNNKKIGKATLVVLPTDAVLNNPEGYKEGSVTATFTIAKCPLNQGTVTVKVSDKPNYYTGKKVEPAVTVEYTYTEQDGKEQKTVTLTKGTDYTVSCTNNVNASVYAETDAQGNTVYTDINPRKIPTVKITGKGSFAGTRTTVDLKDGSKPGNEKLTFKIYPKDLKNTVVTVADLAEKTSAQAPKITVKDGAKTVAASQYVIEEIVRTQDAEGKAVSADEGLIYSRAKGTGNAKVTAAGTYEISIAGKQRSNYEGTKNKANAGFNDKLTFVVVDKDHLIANAKITVNGKFYYTGEGIKLSTEPKTGAKAELEVKAGTEILKGFTSSSAAIQDGVAQDGYYATYSNNVSAGRATVTITGTGSYKGTKTATFIINKRTLAREVSEADRNKKGEMQTPKLSAKIAADKLYGEWTADAQDAEVQGAIINSDDGKHGSLAVPFTGYTIDPDFKFSSINYDPALDQGGADETKQPAAQSAKELASGDYTVSYKVGAWTAGKAPVTVTVKGKGNYSGSVKFDNLFTLTAREFNKLRVEVASATYNGKALKPAVSFYDEDGRVVDLKLNAAYTVSYKNNKDSVAVNKDPNKQPSVTVKVKGKGWITGSDDRTKTLTKNFTIEQAEITGADVGNVVFQTFLGKALKPKVTVKVGGRKLKEGRDYVLTYDNNDKRSGSSTATVTITGKGNYFTRKPIGKVFVIK